MDLSRLKEDKELKTSINELIAKNEALEAALIKSGEDIGAICLSLENRLESTSKSIAGIPDIPKEITIKKQVDFSITKITKKVLIYHFIAFYLVVGASVWFTTWAYRQEEDAKRAEKKAINYAAIQIYEDLKKSNYPQAASFMEKKYPFLKVKDKEGQ